MLGGWLGGALQWQTSPACGCSASTGCATQADQPWPAGVSNAKYYRQPTAVSRRQAAPRGRLQHADLRHYNMVQRGPSVGDDPGAERAVRAGAVEIGAVSAARTLLGGYEAARYIHFSPCRRWWPSSRFTR
ncbi:hypothetical protein M8494_17855 [Serratia ureilytica]